MPTQETIVSAITQLLPVILPIVVALILQWLKTRFGVQADKVKVLNAVTAVCVGILAWWSGGATADDLVQGVVAAILMLLGTAGSYDMVIRPAVAKKKEAVNASKTN